MVECNPGLVGATWGVGGGVPLVGTPPCPSPRPHLLTALHSGSLGSCIDEDRSELRYTG